MKVVISGKRTEQSRQLIRGSFPEDWTILFVSPEEMAAQIGDADVLIPEHAAVGEDLLSRATCLRLVQTGAGYDNVDIEACTRRGVFVANARGINARAVAEHVLAFMLCWFKNLLAMDGSMKEGLWEVDCRGGELSGKVIGVVGLGNTGKEVARLCTAFGMKVLGYHTRPVEADAEIEFTDLVTLLRMADIVTLHISLNESTRQIIGGSELALMKQNALLINTSRGSVIDEVALISALEEGRIGGAALDVFEAEPLDEKSPLRRLRNVILTPHRAGEPDGPGFQEKRFAFFAGNIRRVQEGKIPLNVLNLVHPPPSSPAREGRGPKG
jgi:phosphoglycerate dehydrogenase-like enzyme